MKDFGEVYEKCYADSLSDSLKQVRFAELPTAELYGLACELAISKVDEYVRARLSPDEYKKYHATEKAFGALASVVGITGFEQMRYWAVKLGVCGPDEHGIKLVIDKVRRFCAAECGIFVHQFDELDVYKIAEILKSHAEAMDQDRRTATKPELDMKAAKLIIRREVKAELKLAMTDDVLVAAYKQEGSCRKAAALLSRQLNKKVSKDRVHRAVQRSGGVAAVREQRDSDSIKRTVASQQRDRSRKYASPTQSTDLE